MNDKKLITVRNIEQQLENYSIELVVSILDKVVRDAVKKLPDRFSRAYLLTSLIDALYEIRDPLDETNY